MPKNVPTKVAHRGVPRDAPAACPELAEGIAGGTSALRSRTVLARSEASFTILRPNLLERSLGSALQRQQSATESRKRRGPTCPDQSCGSGRCRRETPGLRSLRFSYKSGSEV